MKPKITCKTGKKKAIHTLLNDINPSKIEFNTIPGNPVKSFADQVELINTCKTTANVVRKNKKKKTFENRVHSVAIDFNFDAANNLRDSVGGGTETNGVSSAGTGQSTDGVRSVRSFRFQSLRSELQSIGLKATAPKSSSSAQWTTKIPR